MFVEIFPECLLRRISDALYHEIQCVLSTSNRAHTVMNASRAGATLQRRQGYCGSHMCLP